MNNGDLEFQKNDDNIYSKEEKEKLAKYMKFFAPSGDRMLELSNKMKK